MLTEPRAGDNISAGWAKELVREIRRNRPIQGENVRLTVTPNGTVIHGTPGGARGGSAASAPGRFAIKKIAREPGAAPSIVLDNCYYRIDGRTFAMSQLEQTVDFDPAAKSALVALKVSLNGNEPAAALVTYADLEALNADEEDLRRYVVPLYLFTDGKLACDFRLGPDLSMGEFLQ